MPRYLSHHCDRHIFSNVPPRVPSNLPNPLKALHAHSQSISDLLSKAFPLVDQPTNRHAILDDLATTISLSLRNLDIDNPHAFLIPVAESGLLDQFCYAFRLVTPVRHISSVLALLRALNTVTLAEFLIPRILTHDIIPHLFNAFLTRETTDLSLALLEELLLHNPPIQLSSVPAFDRIVTSLSPLHLGALCRVLAPLIDERDALCGGDHCTGQCTTLDWRHIDDAATQLRSRTSYIEGTARITRDRNHAVLLAVPHFLNRLVKLVSVPPASRQDLVLVDHAVPTGVFSLDGDVSVTPNPPLPNTLDIIIDDVPPSEEHVHQRIVFMLFRRLTGLDTDDANVTGADSWPIFERRLTDSHPHHPRNRHERDTVDDVSTTATASDAGDAADVPIPGDVVNNGVEEPDVAYPVASINGMLMSRHQIDVLFVLYSLLTGKRRTDVQRILVEAGIFQALNRFCDALDWSDCERETRTEDSLKVHFIRLLHYMCDGLDVTKFPERQRLLFSESEREMIQRIERGHHQPFEPKSPASVAADLHMIDFQKLSLGSPLTKTLATPPPIFPRRESDLRRGTAAMSPPRCMAGAARPPRVSDEVLSDESDERYSSPQPTAKAKIVPDSPIPQGPEKYIPTREQPKQQDEKGIILKMVNVLMATTSKRDDGSNTRRFVLSGCIETFQRSASLAEKTFIARQGLLSHLVWRLADTDVPRSQASQYRQTSFDLLGQLIKWNRDLFNDINEIFRRDRRLFPRLLEAVSDRLVDSNVFVRSIALSLECFRSEDELQVSLGNVSEPSQRLYDFENCFLWEFLETYRVRLIHDLLSSVRVEDITFENICCINTTLILFVVSCRDEESFEDVLSKLADINIEFVRSGLPNQSLFSLKPTEVIQNFSKLVDFWLNYYRHQGVDVFSLEVNTNISFNHFVDMAQKLQGSLPTLDAHIRQEIAADVML